MAHDRASLRQTKTQVSRERLLVTDKGHLEFAGRAALYSMPKLTELMEAVATVQGGHIVNHEPQAERAIIHFVQGSKLYHQTSPAGLLLTINRVLSSVVAPGLLEFDSDTLNDVEDRLVDGIWDLETVAWVVEQHAIDCMGDFMEEGEDVSRKAEVTLTACK